jgi:hypothetical protein
MEYQRLMLRFIKIRLLPTTSSTEKPGVELMLRQLLAETTGFTDSS